MNELIASILPGLGEMANIHPLLVHFPIALLNGFVLMELLGIFLKKEDMRIAATWMLYLGTAGAAGAVVAGFIASGDVPHSSEVHIIMTRHMYFGVAVLSLSLFLSLWRITRGTRQGILHLLAGMIIAVTMTFGADLGGLMVYKYGVAVKAVPQPEVHDHSMKGLEMNNMDMNGNTIEKEGGHHHGDAPMPHDH